MGGPGRRREAAAARARLALGRHCAAARLRAVRPKIQTLARWLLTLCPGAGKRDSSTVVQNLSFSRVCAAVGVFEGLVEGKELLGSCLTIRSNRLEPGKKRGRGLAKVSSAFPTTSG